MKGLEINVNIQVQVSIRTMLSNVNDYWSQVWNSVFLLDPMLFNPF